jgi:hypothetical protein
MVGSQEILRSDDGKQTTHPGHETGGPSDRILWFNTLAMVKAEHFSQFREAFKNCSSELFFWPFERLILIFSAIFWYCMITRQLIVEKMSINYAGRPLEIGKSVQL